MCVQYVYTRFPCYNFFSKLAPTKNKYIFEKKIIKNLIKQIKLALVTHFMTSPSLRAAKTSGLVTVNSSFYIK